MPNKDDSAKKYTRDMAFGLGGILKGLSDLVDKLEDVSENSEEFSKTGELGHGKEVKGIYGFTVKVGLGDDKQPRIEPFGNIRKDRSSGHTVVQEVREPVADVFEEDDHVLVVAEMPGISKSDVHVEVVGDLLTVEAGHGDKKYRKEILLPASYPPESAQVSCHNGVLKIKFPKNGSEKT